MREEQNPAESKLARARIHRRRQDLNTDARNIYVSK